MLGLLDILDILVPILVPILVSVLIASFALPPPRLGNNSVSKSWRSSGIFDLISITVPALAALALVLASPARNLVKPARSKKCKVISKLSAKSSCFFLSENLMARSAHPVP